MHRLTGFLLSLVFLFWASHLQAQEKLEPANTYAVIAGVLQWQNNALSPFSKFNRKDEELYDTLRKRGVPAENMILLLDEKGTHAGICAAVKTIAAKAKPGATLFFYYAGHGSPVGGKICLCNYDFVPKKGVNNGLDVKEIGQILARSFTGGRVFFMADCCYSGGLKQAAELLGQSKISAVSLTSASASNVSTGNWTFTQTILDALHGEPLADVDGDGFITLKDMADEVQTAMKFREKQMYGYVNLGVKSNFLFGPVNPNKKRPQWDSKGGFAAGEYVVAKDGNRDKAGRIVGKYENKYTVAFYDYSTPREVMVPPEALKKIQFWTFKPGQETLVEWGRKLWKAKILKVEGDFHFVTYPGWESSWDEWMLCDRVVDPALASLPEVQVQWKGNWSSARIMKIDNGQYYVHYLGSGTASNEWVPKTRIKGAPGI